MVARCAWCGDDELYMQYHDTEWGVPCYNDRTLFEFLLLEGAQAGLAWITRKGRYRMAEGFASIILIGLMSITMLLNSAVARRYNAGSEALLNNQIAASMSSWDVSEYGVAYRCRLLNEWSRASISKITRGSPPAAIPWPPSLGWSGLSLLLIRQ